MIPFFLTLALAQDAGPPDDTEASEAPEAPVEADAPDASPEPTPEPDPEPAPTPDPEPEPEAEPELYSAGEAPASQPTAKPRPEPKVATWSLSAEYGASRYNDESFDLFGGVDRVDVGGFRLGYRVLDRVEAQVGWLRGIQGAEVEVPNASGGRELAFRTAYDANRFSLGLRADVTLDEVVFLYLAGRGQLVVQRIRIDGDPETKSNPDQLSETALAPGGELVGGFELRIPQNQLPVTVAWTLEMGAETVASATFGDFGDLQSGGFVVHTGLGVRF